MSNIPRKTTPNLTLIPLLNSNEDRVSTQFSNIFTDSDLKTESSDSARQMYIKGAQNEINQSKASNRQLRKVSSFHKYSSSADQTNSLDQVTYLKDTLNLAARPPSQFHPGTRTLSQNVSPSLSGTCQDFYNKQIEVRQSPGIPAIQRLSTQSTFTPDVSKTHYRQEAWRNMRSHSLNPNDTMNFSVNTQRSFEESFAKEKSSLFRKNSGTRKMVGRASQVSVSTNSPEQDSHLKTWRITAGPNSCKSEQGSRPKKITMLNLVQEKATQLLSKEASTSKTTRPGQIRVLTILNSNQFSRSNSCRSSINPVAPKLSLSRERDIFAQDDADNDPVITSFTNRVNSLNRQEVSKEAKEDLFKKKEFRVIRSFETNFYMARIEKEALKDLRAKKKKVKEIVAKERPANDELVTSPVHFKTATVTNPLFNKHDLDKNDGFNIDNKKFKRAETKSFVSILRTRLVKSLNRMKQFKLTPKDLLKYDHIFSITPFEKPGSKKLIAAAKAGDLGAVEQILDKQNRFLVYDFDHVHQTALHWVARKGFANVAELLLKKGADVNARDIAGRTPLFFAMKHQNIGVLKILLAHRADPWSTQDCNYTALAKENTAAKFYLTKARQLHIIMKMTNPSLRDALWEREGLRLMVNMKYGMEDV